MIGKYTTDSDDIVSRFIAGRITFIDCVQALDAALNRIVPTITPEELPHLQAAIKANHERVLRVLRQQSAD